MDDPKDKTFSVFGDARYKIEGGVVTHGRELYFSTYQSIAKDERRPGLFKEFDGKATTFMRKCDNLSLSICNLALGINQNE